MFSREDCSRFFLKELSGLGEVFPLFYLSHFRVRKSDVPRAGERGVWNPEMGETFIVLDANCIGIRARRGNISMVSRWSENDLCWWLLLLMPLNIRMNLDDNSDFWGLILYFLYCVLFFATCKHIKVIISLHVGDCIKQWGLGIWILAEGSINVTEDFIAYFKLMTDCIVLVLNKGISVTFK